MLFISKLWNAQWWTISGVLLSALGVLYTSCSYLDKRHKFIKAITEGMTIGFVLTLLFIIFALAAVVTGNSIDALLNAILHQRIVLNTSDFSVNFSIEVPAGLIMGAVLGVLYSFLRERNEAQRERLKLVFANHLFLFGVVGFVLMVACAIGIVLWKTSPALFSSQQDIFSILIFCSGDIGGFLFGIVIVRGRRSPRMNFLACLPLYLSFLLLFLLLNHPGNQTGYIYENLMQDIFYGAQLGLLVGVSVYTGKRLKLEYQKLEYNKSTQGRFFRWLIFKGKSQWEDFFLWLVLGGLVIPVIYLVVSVRIFNDENFKSPFVFFTLRYFLLLGIVNGRGDQIIERIKLRASIKGEGVYYSISWKRFISGIIIGILYVLPVDLFVLLTDVFSRQTSSQMILNLSQNINFALLVGLIIGFIYGFGPFIISRIDNLEDRQLGQLGIFISELGILVVLIPH